ncbi:MAG: TonB-dependent receptor plug domain-containing protein, partial [Acidobacteria bacterium]|nr:TonB-dependent receptor plug domain-containing protein [Acidobacteriota bacterium]
MSANDDSNAADAMERVTGVSVVDGGSVFVRGLGERYSNTTLAGATLPTTEPDRRVVPLDLFPTALIDSVQVSKTYTPDKPSQFAGGLVEIIPLKMPIETSWEVGAGGGWNSVTTGMRGLSYPSGGREWLGFDDGTRSLPGLIPDRKVIRGGRLTNDELGFLPNELQQFGRSFDNVWDPVAKDHPLDQSYSGLFGGRFGNLGVVTTLRHAQSSSFADERQTFFNVGEGGAINRFNGPYDFDISSYERTLGGVANLSYQFTPNHRLSFENFYTHLGTDQARTFEGFNSDADTDLYNQRLYFIEEQIRAHHVGGEHLFPGASNSRLEWKVAVSAADRDEPDLRETLYEFDPAREAFVLADESQSGLRQFNNQRDDSIEFNASWSSLFQQWGGLPTQVKFGGGYLERDREFDSRRLRFTPRRLSGIDLSLPAEDLFTSANIGPVWQLKEETRPTDSYDGRQELASFYGMVDLPLSAAWRIFGGARVESYRQT